MLEHMAVNQQELEMVMVMLPPSNQSLHLALEQMAQEGSAHPLLLSQALGLRKSHPLQKEKAGLLAKPPE